MLHDGGTIRLRKLHADYDPTDKIAAMDYLQERARAAGEIVTGLLYVASEDAHDLHDAQETVATPLNALGDADLVPGSAALAAFNASFAGRQPPRGGNPASARTPLGPRLRGDDEPGITRSVISIESLMRIFWTILGIAGALVLLVLVGVAIAVWTVDVNQFVGPIQARVKNATGRDLTIGGRHRPRSSASMPKLVVKDVRFGNAPGAREPQMLTREVASRRRSRCCRCLSAASKSSA